MSRFDLLATRSAGLIALTAGGEGGLARLLAEGLPAQAADYADRLQAVFGDRLYVEIARRGDATEMAAEAALIDLAYARNLPLVATNPCCFAESAFGDAHDVMLCIASSSYVESEDRPRSCPEAWLKDAESMRALFADLPEAFENTLVVAQRCAVMAPSRKPILPTLAGDLAGEADMLRRDARAGLEMRLAKIATLAGANERSFPREGGGPEAMSDAPATLDSRHRGGNGRLADPVPRPPGVRTRRHHPDGLPRLFPDRRGLHQMGEGP